MWVLVAFKILNQVFAVGFTVFFFDSTSIILLHAP